MDQSQLYVWCASLIRNNEDGKLRIKTLGWMIDSVKYFYPHAKIFVSVSILGFDSENVLKYDDNVTFFIHKYKKFQFDHLHHIYKNTKLGQDDYILFMDDDDLIIETTDYKNYEVLRGRQVYKDVGHEKLLECNHEQIIKQIKLDTGLDIKDIHDIYLPKFGWEITGDFSGYFSKFKYVDSYFKSRIMSICKPTEDLHFMTHLNKNIDYIYKHHPFVFFRYRYSDGKEWINDITNGITKKRKNIFYPFLSFVYKIFSFIFRRNQIY